MLSLGFTELYSDAHIAQLVEHILGKDEVNGSNPFVGSRFYSGFQVKFKYSQQQNSKTLTVKITRRK